jgi:hypothetical protein
VSDASAVVIGASISAVIAVLVVLLTAYLERARKSRGDSAFRLAEYLASTHAGSLAIGELARVPASEKKVAREAVMLLVDRKNTVFNAIKLLEVGEIVCAAKAIDDQLIALLGNAEKKEYEDDWGDQRELLDKAVEEFIATSRKTLRVKD